jgi:DNA-directed RNA polymerase specialized sigma24 family protein
VTARSTDDDAFGSLLECHRRGLELFCLLMLGDPDVASDAMAETVLAASHDCRLVEDQATARMWLYRIATHVCLEAIDAPRRRTGSV